jgi:hypothetical protein
MYFEVSLEGHDLIALLKKSNDLELFKGSKPDEFDVDDSSKKFLEDWIDRYALTCKRNVSLDWGKSLQCSHSIIFQKGHVIKIRITDNPPENIDQALNFLKLLPWTVGSFRSTHINWSGEDINYSGSAFANLHYSLGWGCAFKGEGHQRVVSRRYLDYGPWHVIRDEANDITLIQFHDLNADALTALEQAKPGHKLMSDPYEGGFIQRDYKIFNDDFSGLYSPSEKMLRFIINDRPITRAELLDACAIRLWQLLGDEQPVERVGYVFVIEEEARQNLHELWLRNIECWTYLEGIETRIDQDYTPPLPEKPEWVKRLELSPVS